MNKTKLFGITILMILCTVLFASVVSATPLNITIDEVEVDGNDIQANTANRLDIERNQEVDVKVRFTPNTNLDDVEVRCFISGFEYNDYEPAEDLISSQDYDVNVTYSRKCKIYLSENFEEDDYKLRILFTDRSGDALVSTYNMKVDVPRHKLSIKDVIFYPSNTVDAGKALLTTVRIGNNGEKDQDDVKISVSIPDLGINGVDYIDEIEFDDEEETEEIFLRIPEGTKNGNYPVNILVEYGDYHRSVSKSTMIKINGVEDEHSTSGSDKGKSTIIFGSDKLDIDQGENAYVSLMIKNEGSTSKTYTVNVLGSSRFADVRVTPQNMVIVEAGQEKSLSLFVSVHEDAQAGPNVFTVTVDSDGKEVQQMVTVNVDDNGYEVENILEIALVVLIVILVIIGLIVAFRKLKDNEDEEDLEGQTYY